MSTFIPVPGSLQPYLTRFEQTGSLGAGADRHEQSESVAGINLMTNVRDYTDLTELDQTDADKDRHKNLVEIKPDRMKKYAPPNFGEVHSFKIEYAGKKSDPDSATVHIDGGDYQKFGRVTSTPSGVTFFEAVARPGSAMIVAKTYTVGDQVKGVTEVLEVPWHVAR